MPGPKPNLTRRPDLTPEQAKLFEKHYQRAEGVGCRMLVGKSTPLDIECAAASVEDAKQGALMGLWEAVLGWKKELGFSFWTYAFPIVRGRALDELRRMYPRPKGKRKMLDLTVRFEQICRAMRRGNDEFDGKLTEADLVTDTRERAVGDELADRDELAFVLSKGLTNLQRTVLVMYFMDDMKMRDIGDRLHVSESRVSQIMTETIEFLAEKYPPDPESRASGKERRGVGNAGKCRARPDNNDPAAEAEGAGQPDRPAA